MALPPSTQMPWPPGQMMVQKYLRAAVPLLLLLSVTACESSAGAAVAAALPTIEVSRAVPTPISVNGSKQRLNVVCQGNSVSIGGDENIITLLGPCDSLALTGSRNQIYLQQQTNIADTGAGNIFP